MGCRSVVSIEIHVLFHGKLPSKAALARCFKELGFPLAFAPGSGSLGQHKGYLPMRLRGEELGVEFDTCNDRKQVEEIAGKRINPRFTRSANFRLGGDEDELTVALCFAAALAKLVDGAVFDPQEACLQTVEQAIDQAKKQIAAMAPKSKVRGTRPADIKHYLKPLLQMRSDLVLVDRLLLIRPVRHLIRGVYFDRTSSKYLFRVWSNMRPLFAAGGDPFGEVGDIHDGAFKTWQPHFEALLMDRMAEEIFSKVGKVATLVDLASASRNIRTKITAFVLAGESDKAVAYVEQQDRAAGILREHKEHLEHVLKNVEATCAECHANEAEVIRALKLEHVWEPAPFPVELPADQRTVGTAEPPFVATPWPARPPWLWQEVPQQPGEVRYAKRWLWRSRDVLLLVALTKAECEERHRENETYVVAERLTDGLLLLVSRSTGYDRHCPPEDRYGYTSYSIVLLSCCYEVCASAPVDSESPEFVEIDSIRVSKRGSPYSIWSYGTREGGKAYAHDQRSGEIVASSWAMTPEERDLRILRCPESPNARCFRIGCARCCVSPGTVRSAEDSGCRINPKGAGRRATGRVGSALAVACV